MKFTRNFSVGIIALILLISCSADNDKSTELSSSVEITKSEIMAHITYLADDALKGRQAGTAGEAKAANYIADYFSELGLIPAGDNGTYFQEFTIGSSPASPVSGSEKHISRNVVGIIKGTAQNDDYIIIGAHYDHLGYGTFGSLYNRDTTSIHNGADDNASGTAGILELAQFFNRQPTNRNLLFIAFSGEEMGLLGSRYFVEQPTISLSNTLAMINMDMIGRLTDNRLLIFGTGSAPVWERLIDKNNVDSLLITNVPDGTGASDHTPFYNNGIPVLHYFTDTHSDYHRPSDDPNTINAEGEVQVLNHVKRMISTLDTLSLSELTYTESSGTHNQNRSINGVTLGVTPDYSFKGSGMRITGVRNGGPADRAGLQKGDVITRLNGENSDDLYAYMEILKKLDEGQQTTVTVIRDGLEQTFELDLRENP